MRRPSAPAKGPSAGVDAAIGRELTAWFARHRRRLPWRRHRTPYRIWVAEVLLQQTRVASATRYYERFLRAFPTVRTLAAASETDVLKAWEGAGYYARARYLRRAAQEVVRRFGGRLPRSPEQLRALPGVGPYVSAAVASIAFDAPVPALEANGIRVLARVALESGDPNRREVRSRLENRLKRWLPARSPGRLNEAVMELGETVCVPHRPRCGSCPIGRFCRARAELPDPGVLPQSRPRPLRRLPHVVAAVAAVERDGRWLVGRRRDSGLLGGMYEFPGGKVRRGETARAACRREVLEETGVRLGSLTPLGVVRHRYSHFSVELHAFRGAVAAGSSARVGSRRFRWLTPEEFARLPRPRATEKIVELVQRSAPPPGESSLG